MLGQIRTLSDILQFAQTIILKIERERESLERESLERDGELGMYQQV